MLDGYQQAGPAVKLAGAAGPVMNGPECSSRKTDEPGIEVNGATCGEWSPGDSAGPGCPWRTPATNWKCSILLLAVLALAAVTLVPAITAARESVPAAAPRNLPMMPPVISAADCAGTLARAWERGRYFYIHGAQPISQAARQFPALIRRINLFR